MARSTLVVVVLVVFCFMHRRRKVLNIGGAKVENIGGQGGKFPAGA